MIVTRLVVTLLLTAATPLVAVSEDTLGRDARQLENRYDAFVETLDRQRIARDFPQAVGKLDADDPQTVMAGLRILASSDDVAAIPWIVPYLDADDSRVRIWAGRALATIISDHQLKRRDWTQPSKIVIQPRAPGDRDLEPLAWIALKMLRKPDDGSTHSYAATIIGYLQLTDFESELIPLLNSPHPAVNGAARNALEMIGSPVRTVFTDQEVSSARATGESFAEVFRDNDEDNLGLLLVPKAAVGQILNAKVLANNDADALYQKMIAGNTARFREFRSMFNDLSKTNKVTFAPGGLSKSDFYAPGVRVMKNSFVTLAYANRVEVKIKIEEMVFIDGKCYIVEID